MNDIFRPILRKFVLVFFDDILVYSKDLHNHMLHLKKVLNMLRQHQLYAKKSKCHFAYSEIDYLGHLIYAQGVRADPWRIVAMLDWPILKNLKTLREFLELTSSSKGMGRLQPL